MSLLCPTPPERWLDERGRPYFLWDTELTLDELRAGLRSEDAAWRSYLWAKLLRQAKPDDVFQLVDPAELGRQWPAIAQRLGDKGPFWRWLLERWGIIDAIADQDGHACRKPA